MRTCIPRPSRLPTHLRCKYFNLYRFKILSPAYLCNSLLWWIQVTVRMDSVLRINSGLLTQPETIHHHTILVFHVSYKNNNKKLFLPLLLSYIDSAPSIRESASIFPETWDQKLGYWVIYLWRAPVETHIPGSLAIIWHTKQEERNSNIN